MGDWDHNGVRGDARTGPAEFSLNSACEISGGEFGYTGRTLSRTWTVGGKVRR